MGIGLLNTNPSCGKSRGKFYGLAQRKFGWCYQGWAPMRLSDRSEWKGLSSDVAWVSHNWHWWSSTNEFGQGSVLGSLGWCSKPLAVRDTTHFDAFRDARDGSIAWSGLNN